MLLQSHAGEISLLPALPQDWHTGSFSGLRVKGNAEVDLIWEQGKLVSATIQAFSAGRTVLRYRDQVVPLKLESGHTYTLNDRLDITIQ